MRQRCIWSNRADNDVRDVEMDVLNRWGTRIERRTLQVCPEHEPDVRRFMTLVVGPGRWFLPLMLLVTLATIAGAFADSRALVAGSIVAMGALMLAFPFATPETVQMTGLRTSIRLARFLGVVTVLLGGAILFLP